MAMKCQHCGGDNADDARFCGVCGRATSATEPSLAGEARQLAPAPDLVGREIGGRFRILAKLGEGGMGAVYRGEQISLKRRVAIKLLRPELSRDPGIVRRFNHEAEAVAKLSHPNTVSIFDFGQDADGTLFIAMEYLEGKSLRQVTTEGPVPFARALHIGAQIAASLTDAHRHGIVHRDLKPDNVMLTERGRDRDVVRVLDFGIAKLRDEQNKATVNPMTMAGDLVGTPQYMAPEQIRGETVDGRTDVYALGAILYEMVTGRMPFEGPTVMVILSRHLLEMPAPPSQRRPELGIPQQIDALVMEMLAKDPAHRIASMEGAAERIAQLAVSLGGSPSAGYVAGVPTGAVGAVGTPSPGPPSAGGTPNGPRAMSRPPGVPQTMPPGMMMAPPDGRAQPVPQVSQAQIPTHAQLPPQAQVPTAMHGMGMPPTQPMPQPMQMHGHAMAPTGPMGPGGQVHVPTPHPQMAPMAPMMVPHPGMAYVVAKPRASRMWLWILLGTLLGATLIGAVVVGMRKQKKEEEARGSASGTGYEGGNVVVTRPPDAAPAQLSGDVANFMGWQVRLPVGFLEVYVEGLTAGKAYSGTLGGNLAFVVALAAPAVKGQESKLELDAGCQELAAKLFTGTMTSSSMVTGNDPQFYRCEINNGMQRGEGVMYVASSTLLILFFVADSSSYDGMAAERREFFERRVTPPGS